MSKTLSQAFPLTALAAAVVGVTLATATPGQTSAGSQESRPSAESVRSLLMNNWTDLLAIHYARKLYAKDSHLFGPYLSALHSAVDWPVNQIDGATAFFHADVLDGSSGGAPEQPPTLCDSSGEVKGDDAPADPGLRQSYPSVMCFGDDGVLNVEYVREGERGLPIHIQKSYAMVPAQPFLVVRYTVSNNFTAEDNKRLHVRFGEVVDLHNKASPKYEKSASDLVDTGLFQAQPGQPLSDMQAEWYPQLSAWIADMSASNGTFLVFGTFQDMDRHRAFVPVSDQIEFDRAVGAEINIVDQAQPPQNVDQLTAKDIGLSLWKDVVLAPGARQQYAFFYAVTSNLSDAQSIALAARAGNTTADSWFNDTKRAYQTWLQQGRQIQTPDAGLSKALTRALIAIKQAQQPAFGSFVAATNPAYGFKVWPRDSSVTALGLAASGHLDEAAKFYQWMASVQEDGTSQNYPPGTWFSNYGYWMQKRPKSFVEPEWDSLGLFMIGVYHTWRLLKDRDPQAAHDFLTGPLQTSGLGPLSVYDAVRRTAGYLSDNINEHDFGPGDFSIWEEDFAWNTFTQVTYASGLNAARLLAGQMGDTDSAGRWLNAGRRVLNAIHRSASAQPCPGLWNDVEARSNRATWWPTCAPDSRLDSSTDLLWVFGLVDSNDQRATSQRSAVLSRLTHTSDHIGISRYEGDEFYHASPFSPGGQFEASASMPSWPQMDMYVDMLEHWRGLDDIALKRLQWYVTVTNAGYMPPGEAVDWQTERPLPSTSSEPVTAAWYIMGLVNYLNMFDPRLPPLQ